MRISWIISALIVFVIIMSVVTYNGIVRRQQQVLASWAQVENVYQRRADLIPNLVATVKGYAAFEKSTLTQVVNARSAALQAQQTVPKDTLPTNSQLQQIDATQKSLNSALGRLLVIVERYPELKASQNFLALQVELAGSENRVAVERRRFNEQARVYNAYILSFPQNLMANMFGFKPTSYFAAHPNAEEAPQVDFSK